MLNKKKSMLFLLILVSLCAPVAAADTVIAQYVKNGGNGGFPYENLKVYQSGKAELITDNFSSSSTINYTLTPTELGASCSVRPPAAGVPSRVPVRRPGKSGSRNFQAREDELERLAGT